MNRRALILANLIFSLGCASSKPRPAAEEGSSPVPADEEVALEELEMEDAEALTLLIADRLSALDRPAPRRPSDSRAPTAEENWKLTPSRCLRAIRREGIQVRTPDFKTPSVRTPLILDGPVGGVEIEPHWPRKSAVNEVMDCHLVLALVEVARQARALGIKRIEYYSAYRPIPMPPEKCARGKKGARCRRLTRAYKKAKKSPSQHSRALAIDIRWLAAEDSETIDVLEHFDRRSRNDPCSYRAGDNKGRILQDLACGLYRAGIFNVMLTPNANKAHHNHFHFDITPNASWYIIR